MRVAVLSDIHGNLPALEAVLADIRRQQVDAVYCLGDLGMRDDSGKRHFQSRSQISTR